MLREKEKKQPIWQEKRVGWLKVKADGHLRKKGFYDDGEKGTVPRKRKKRYSLLLKKSQNEGGGG